MKKIISILIIFAIIFCATSCNGNSATNGIYNDENIINGDKGPTVYTLSEYLNSGKTLILYGETMLPERNDTINCIVIFKDNRMSVYSGVDKATGWKEIRIGEISKMTDEEIIDKCEQTLYKYASNVEYDLHVYTDGTGNFTDYEKIEFDDITEVNPNTNYLPLHLSNICIYNSDINIPAVVYDSTFYKLPDDEKAGKKGYWYRSDGYTLNLDTPYSEGVLVDPCYNENSQDNDNLLDLYNALRELENDKESKSDKDEIS